MALRYSCCFCGKTVAPEGKDPVALSIQLPDGGTQELYCHLQCLQRALDCSVPLAL